MQCSLQDSILDPVAATGDLYNSSMMSKSVNNDFGHCNRGEYGSPLGEREIACQDHASLFIAFGNDGEEQLRLFLRKLLVTDLVDHQERGLRHVLHELCRRPCPERGVDLLHAFPHRKIVGLEPRLDAELGQCDGEVALSCSRIPDEDDILLVVQEPEGGEIPDPLLVDGRLVGEVEVVQALVNGDSRKLLKRLQVPPGLVALDKGQQPACEFDGVPVRPRLLCKLCYF